MFIVYTHLSLSLIPNSSANQHPSDTHFSNSIYKQIWDPIHFSTHHLHQHWETLSLLYVQDKNQSIKVYFWNLARLTVLSLVRFTLLWMADQNDTVVGADIWSSTSAFDGYIPALLPLSLIYCVVTQMFFIAETYTVCKSKWCNVKWTVVTIWFRRNRTLVSKPNEVFDERTLIKYRFLSLLTAAIQIHH